MSVTFKSFAELELGHAVAAAPALCAGVAVAASLSKSHICITEESHHQPTDDLELDENWDIIKPKRILAGSHAKTAFALRMNVAAMVEKFGVNRCGFQTLTIGDYVCAAHGQQMPTGAGRQCPVCEAEMGFQQVFDMVEAQCRLHSFAANILKKYFLRGVIVTERCQNGAIHFHLLGVMLQDCDIRTGFNFEQVKQRDYSSACPALRALWAQLRRALPRYRFGRSELLPIRKTGAAVASYISQYIEKNVLHRPAADKGKRLVRYFGWHGEQLKTSEFEWASKNAGYWRAKVGQLAKLDGLRVWDDSQEGTESRLQEFCDLSEGRIRPKSFVGEQIAERYGPRWAYKFTNVMREVWGDDCDVLPMTPRSFRLALALLDEERLKYEGEVVDTFRWAKGLEINLFMKDIGQYCPLATMPPQHRMDAETSMRDWWAMEDAAKGFTVPEHYFDGWQQN